MSAKPIAKASLTPVGREPDRVQVHFNPVSLEHSVALNTDKEQQFTGKGTAKLAFELIFDTTDKGTDVRTDTQRVLMLLKPPQASDPKAAAHLAPPQVKFEWGAFTFTGVMEGFAETLDYWAPEGVPLRASMKIALMQPAYAFEPETFEGTDKKKAAVAGGGESPSGLAASSGLAGAARSIAAANGLESLRAEVSGGLVIPAMPMEFTPPAAMAGTAELGAFAELRTEARATVHLSPDQILSTTPSTTLQAGAQFDVSGRALSPSGSSFRADVSGGITFDT